MQIPDFVIDKSRELLTIQPFIQNITYTALAQGASLSGSFTTQNDSDFVIMKTTYYNALATTAAPTDSSRVLPWVTALMNDSGSGRNLSQSAVMLTSIFGTGELPYIWPVPYKVAGNSTFSVTLANITTGAGESYNIRLQFSGVKIFYGAGSSQVP